MSDFAEKLAAPARTTAGRAQATRKQLLVRYGSKQPDERTIVIDSIGGREVWRRIGGGDVFEIEVRP